MSEHKTIVTPPGHLHGDPKLANMQLTVNRCLQEIEGLFKPGIQITLFVCRPGHPGQDVVIGSGTKEELRAMIDRRFP